MGIILTFGIVARRLLPFSTRHQSRWLMSRSEMANPDARTADRSPTDAGERVRVQLELRAVSGPTAVSFSLQQPGPLTIGRRSINSLQLHDPAISRDHAQLSFRPRHGPGDALMGEWLLGDLGSTHGTWLNGVRLKADRSYHLRAGDLIVIGPWTLLVVDRSSSPRPGTALATVDETGKTGTVVSSPESETDTAMSRQELLLLQRCSESIHAARREVEIAEAVLDAALEGTNFTKAALLRPMIGDDVVEAISCRDLSLCRGAGPQVSRALVREAASGSAVCLQQDPAAQSAGQMRIEPENVVALCVPIRIETTLAGLVYLDSPLNTPPRRPQDATATVFVLGLAHLAALGMANLMRMDIERRQERIETELHAAEEAQRWLLPQREGHVGPFRYAGETRQGRDVGGDFFDVIPLDHERLAVVLGDVGGRGVSVSVLVSASLGFLHARLLELGDPAVAVDSINRFYHSRLAHSQFLKLWVGLFDAGKRALTYVTACHGCAVHVGSDGGCELLELGGSPPVGMKPDAEYEVRTVALTPGARILLLSDGFVGQRAHDLRSGQSDDTPSPREDEPPQCFGISRAERCLQGLRVGEDEIAALFSALERHVGAPIFDDDASALIVRW